MIIRRVINEKIKCYTWSKVILIGKESSAILTSEPLFKEKLMTVDRFVSGSFWKDGSNRFSLLSNSIAEATPWRIIFMLLYTSSGMQIEPCWQASSIYFCNFWLFWYFYKTDLRELKALRMVGRSYWCVLVQYYFNIGEIENFGPCVQRVLGKIEISYAVNVGEDACRKNIPLSKTCDILPCLRSGN